MNSEQRRMFSSFLLEIMRRNRDWPSLTLNELVLQMKRAGFSAADEKLIREEIQNLKDKRLLQKDSEWRTKGVTR
jgi:hypothetical protein